MIRKLISTIIGIILMFGVSSSALAGLSETILLTVTVTDNDPPPFVEILSPIEGQAYSGSFEIRGTATDDNFDYAQQYHGRGAVPTEWLLDDTYDDPFENFVVANADISETINGVYSIKFWAIDTAGHEAEDIVIFSIENPLVLHTPASSEEMISPNADGNKDTVVFSAYTNDPRVNWDISIKNDSNVEIRHISGSGAVIREIPDPGDPGDTNEAAVIEQVWDGKNNSGVVVLDGNYTFEIMANYNGQTVGPVGGQVEVDTAPPIAQIISPQDYDVISGTIEMIGTATDANFEICEVYHGLGDAPAEWELLNESYTIPQINAVLLSANIMETVNGLHSLRIVVKDKAGNESIDTLIVEFQNEFRLSDGDVSEDLFSPNTDGNKDTVTISARTNEETAAWTIIIKDSIGAEVKQFSGQGAQIEQIWDGKDDFGVVVPDGVYTYEIRAAYNSQTLGPLTGTVEIDTVYPAAVISYPQNDDVVTEGPRVDVIGTATDDNFVRCTVYSGYGSNPDEWGYRDTYNEQKSAEILAVFGVYSPLINTTYGAKISVLDRAGNESVATVVFDVNLGFYITNQNASSAFISPNADGANDTTTITADVVGYIYSSTWLISIRDSINQEVKQFSGSGNINQIWDGKDAQGQVVPDGEYTYVITATFGEQTTDPVQGTITKDTGTPIALITSPQENEIIDDGHTDLIGTVGDENLAQYSVYYGQGNSPAEWHLIGAETHHRLNDELVVNGWYTQGLGNGAYTVRLLVEDKAGNKAIDDVLVEVNNGFYIENYNANPENISPNNDGFKDSTVINATVVGYETNWTIAIKDIENNIIRQINGFGFSINFVWDGNNESGETVPDGIYTIEITAAYNTITTDPVGSQIQVDVSPPIAIIASPQENAVVSGYVEISGTAADESFKQYSVFYGEGAAPAEWSQLAVNSYIKVDEVLAYWDTRDLNNGTYCLKLVVEDNHNLETEQIIQVEVDNGFSIINFWMDPDYISPNGDNFRDTTSFHAQIIGYAADWAISIKNSENMEVRRLSGQGYSVNVSWDGKNESGIVVPDGDYTWELTAVYNTHTADPINGTIKIDAAFPIAEIISPLQDEAISGEVDIMGTANDANFHSFSLHYGKGTDPQTWVSLCTSQDPVTNGMLNTWNTNNLVNGIYTLRLGVWDEIGNSVFDFVPVFLANDLIFEDVNITRDRISPNDDGLNDNTIITAWTNEAEAVWTISIKDSTETVVREFTGQGSDIEQVWDGKNEGGVVVDGEYSCEISAEYNSQTVSVIAGTVIVDITPPTAIITSPVENDNVAGIVTITGQANDIHLSSRTLYYGQGAGPTEWIQLSNVDWNEDGFSATWDTSGLTNGVCVLRLVVNDNFSQQTINYVSVNVQNPLVLISPSVDFEYITPNGDGIQDNVTITAVVNEPQANWTISIKDSTETVVREFTGQGSDIEQVWDGKDEFGVVVPDGEYTYEVTAEYDTQTAGPVSGTVIVDNTLPIAEIISPQENGTIMWFMSIIGTAKDDNIADYSISYGRGDAPDTWSTSSLTLKSPRNISRENIELATWNTSDNFNDRYTIKLSVIDLAGNTSTAEVRVDLATGLWIQDAASSLNYMSPNGDGVKDTAAISGRLNEEFANWKVEIKTSWGAVIRQFSGLGYNISQVWDGKDETGTVVDDGAYIWEINAEYNGQTASPESGWITVDLNLPTVSITTPGENDIVSGSVKIIGTATDANFYYYKFSYGVGADPVAWNNSNNISTPVEDGVLATWSTGNLINGIYSLRIMAWDRLLQVSSDTILVTVANELTLQNSSVSLDVISPNEDGQNDSTIITAWTNEELATWAISIKNSTDGVAREFTGQGSDIEQAWDGKNETETVVADGEYTYEVSVEYNSQTVGPIGGTIIVDSTAPIALISLPGENDIVSGNVDIIGIAADPNMHKYYIHYGKGTAPTEWTNIKESTQTVDNAVLFTWDTLNRTNGIYTLRLLVRDIVNNESMDTVSIILNNELILDNLTISLEVISPNADGNNDSTTITAWTNEELANWTISIKDSASTIVRQFTGQGSDIEQVWDGKNETETVVADGEYTYEVSAEYNSQTAGPIGGTIIVDSTVPIAVISSPGENETVWGDISVIGTANDANLLWYRVYYGEGENPQTWYQLISSSNSVVSGQLTSWDTLTFPNGIYTLKLLVRDTVSNISEYYTKVNLENMEIKNVSASQQFINPAHSEISTIDFILDRDAQVAVKMYHVYIRFNSLEGTYTRSYVDTVATVFGQAGGNSCVWDGRDSGGDLMSYGAYVYELEALAPDGRNGFYGPDYVRGFVDVTNMTVNANANPYYCERYKIDYDISQPAFVVIAFKNLVGAVLWGEPRSAGGHYEYWDGRNPFTGKIVNNQTTTLSGFAWTLPDNCIVVYDDTLEITELSSGSFLIQPGYSQVSSIGYAINEDAEITIKLSDPNGNYCKTLIDNSLVSAGAYQVEWDGMNDDGELVSIEGDYIIEVTASTPGGETTVIRRGNIKVYK
ncbi:MAG: FlgD immunoglobulin-like domain containing protein [Candidatus Omnitrophota bacterium]